MQPSLAHAARGDYALDATMTDSPRTMGLSTTSVHAGEGPPRGPLEQPIVLSSAFAFASAEEAEGAFRGENDAYVYGRWGNPNVDLLERKLAALEGAEDAAISASGMSAIGGAMLALLSTGDHIVAPRALYGETARLFRERLPRLGITTTFVDDVSPDAYRAALTTATITVTTRWAGSNDGITYNPIFPQNGAAYVSVPAAGSGSLVTTPYIQPLPLNVPYPYVTLQTAVGVVTGAAGDNVAISYNWKKRAAGGA